MTFKIFFVALFLTTFAIVSPAQSTTKEEQALISVIKQTTEAQTNYDQAALARIFTSDYIEISPAGEFDPREKVLSFYSPQAKAEAAKSSASVEATEFSTRVYDKVAVVIARLNFNVVNDGKPLPPRSMRVTFVFRKDKGTWKIASTQYTGIRQAPPQKPN